MRKPKVIKSGRSDHCEGFKSRYKVWGREVGEYHIFLARRLARLQHHDRHQIAPSLKKKKKVRMDQEGMPMGGLSWRKGLWGPWMMVERDPPVYGLVNQRGS